MEGSHWSKMQTWILVPCSLKLHWLRQEICAEWTLQFVLNYLNKNATCFVQNLFFSGCSSLDNSIHSAFSLTFSRIYPIILKSRFSTEIVLHALAYSKLPYTVEESMERGQNMGKDLQRHPLPNLIPCVGLRSSAQGFLSLSQWNNWQRVEKPN